MSLNGKLERAERDLKAAEAHTAVLMAPTWLYFETPEAAALARQQGLIPRGCKVYVGIDVMALV